MADPTALRVAQLEAEVAALKREMQDFTYTVSHDLRAPLRHIVSYVQLVQEDAGPQLDEEVQGFLVTITDSARHMGVMLDALLELSRVGTVALSCASVSLQELVAEVVDALRAQHSLRQIEWRIAGDLPRVAGDAALLRQILQQVIGNAVKFSGARAPAQIAVAASWDEATQRVTLEVRDNGAGYNPALQAKLFQPFARLHSVKQFEGLGMGLALTRKMVERMGGSVEIQGAVDQGCSLRLHLPFSPS